MNFKVCKLTKDSQMITLTILSIEHFLMETFKKAVIASGIIGRISMSRSGV